MSDKNENECYVDGVKYIAVINDDMEEPCKGCAGRHDAIAVEHVQNEITAGEQSILIDLLTGKQVYPNAELSRAHDELK